MAEERFTHHSLAHAVRVGVILGALETTRLATAQASRPAELALFRVVQWNDAHVDETQPPGHRMTNKKMTYWVGWANDTRLPRPSFVIAIGDRILGRSGQGRYRGVTQCSW
jgi:hypothetical protein